MHQTLVLQFVRSSPAEPEEGAAILAAARAGQPDALAALYDRFGRELYGFALWRTGSPAAAEDAVQDLFCKLASERRDSEAVRSPRAWLLTTLRRLIIDRERRIRRETPLDEPIAALALVAGSSADAEREAERGKAARALAQLPPKLREALYLRNWSGLTYAEIGRVTRVPGFTAASRCRLGLMRLRRLLGVETPR